MTDEKLNLDLFIQELASIVSNRAKDYYDFVDAREFEISLLRPTLNVEDAARLDGLVDVLSDFRKNLSGLMTKCTEQFVAAGRRRVA
jgi:hypothetical protein